MCVRAGRYGRPTPLVVDLPRRGWGGIFQIVVFISGTAEPSIGDDRSGECNRPTAAVFGEPSTGDHGSGECNSPTAALFAEPSQVGSQSRQSVRRELLRNPSGSAGQSLTEHPDVFIEVARANLLVVGSRCRSIRKEMSQARDRLVHLQQQNVGALPKEERKAVIKEMRKLKEKMTKLEEAAALANEEFAKEQDKVTRAELRFAKEQDKVTRAELRHGV